MGGGGFATALSRLFFVTALALLLFGHHSEVVRSLLLPSREGSLPLSQSLAQIRLCPALVSLSRKRIRKKNRKPFYKRELLKRESG